MAKPRIRHQSSDGCFEPSPLSSPAASLGKEQTEPKRCLTPRGLIFPSLQDAHRNITNRSLASNNPFRDEQAHVSDTDDNDTNYQLTSDLTSSSLDNIASSSPWGKPVVENPVRSNDLESNVISSPPLVSMGSGRSLTDVRRLHQAAVYNSTDVVNRVKVNAGTRGVNNDGSPDSKNPSENTVERIYGDYAADVDASSPTSQENNGTASPQAPLRVLVSSPGDVQDSAVNHFGLRDEEEATGESECPDAHGVSRRSSVQRQDFSRARPHLRVEPTSSQPPLIALPKCPARASEDTLQASRHYDFESPPADSSVTDSQLLLDAGTHFQPSNLARLDGTRQPLKSPFHDNRAAKHGHPGGYFGCDGQSSIADTQSDLFKYDNEVYRNCLGSIRERDVSNALNGLSKANYEGFRDRLRRRRSVSDCGSLRESGSSPWEDVHSSFFDADALDSLEGGPSKDRNVKVIIKGRQQDENHELEKRDQVGDIYRRDQKHGVTQDRLYREETNGADWETVATMNFDRESKSPEGLFGAGIQATGSSLANLSDDDNFDPGNPFDNRDFVLQHPPANENSSAFYKRTLKGTNQPIMLPGPNRRPAFPSNSTRGIPDSINDSNPFRQNSNRRAKGQYHCDFPKGKDGHSKYAFRDSTSEYAPAFASTQALDGSDIAGTHVDLRDLPDIRTPRRQDHPRGDFALGDGSPAAFAHANAASFDDCEASVVSPSFQFGFELLPLDQAKRKQRTQRDSGQSDQTNNRGRASVQSARERQDSSSPQTTSNMVSPPMAARIRGPNSAVLVASTGKCSNPDQPLLLNDQLAQSPITPITVLHDGRRDSVCWPGRHTSRMQTSQLAHAFKGTLQMKGTVCSSVDDNQISYHARARREFWFYMMVALSVLPFFALLVLMGVFNDALSWFTQGEVYKLTRQQRRVIQLMFIVECILYTGCLSALIVYFAIRSQHF